MGHMSVFEGMATSSSPSGGQLCSGASPLITLKKRPEPVISTATPVENNSLCKIQQEQSRLSTPAHQDKSKNGVPVYKHTVDLEDYTRNFKGSKLFGYQFLAPLKWDKIFMIFAIHIFAVLCLFFFPLDKVSKESVAWAFVMGMIGGFGVTGGAHRYWTHRSFKANLPLRIIMMLCFTASGQNNLYEWVRDHRVHHKYSETDADPHNANRGFFFSHVGWLMMYKHPEVLKRGRQIDMSDILADGVVQFHVKYFIPLKIFCCFLLPSFVPIYFWNDIAHYAIVIQCVYRYLFLLNFTWLVNSAAHMWGNKPYDKRISPTENVVVSILAMGEGWHNYHHVFPWDYKAAELGRYSLNYTTMILDGFSKIGWCWDMKQPSKELVRRTYEKYGDGSHESQRQSNKTHIDSHIYEVPDPELSNKPQQQKCHRRHDEDSDESSSTESTKLDENDNLTKKPLYID